MCGIIGYVNSSSNFDLNILKHRGPDAQSKIKIGNVNLDTQIINS